MKRGIFFLLILLSLSMTSAAVVINEFTTDPQTDWSGNGPITDTDEFIEIYNNENSTINLTGWNITINDSSPEVKELSGSISGFEFFTFLNPPGAINNNGQMLITNDVGSIIDSVAFGTHDDGNLSDNAPDGNANSPNDECLARIPNGVDTNIDSNDFIKTNCTFGLTNNITLEENETETNITGNISITDKSFAPSCLLKTNNLTLYANVSSPTCIGNVTFSALLDGIWQNFTGEVSLGPGNYSAQIPSNLLPVSQFINFTVFADDCFNNTVQDGIHSVYINNITSLTIDPSAPDGISPWYITEPEFTLTNPDAAMLFYEWDSTGFLDYASPFGLEDAPNNGNVTGGVFELKYKSDVCNESFQNMTLRTDFTNPLITDFAPANDSMIFTQSPKISVLLDELYQSNSGINLSSVRIFLNDIDLTILADIALADDIDATVMLQTSNLSLGEYNVTINASDNAGRNSQITWFFTIAEPPPFNLTVYFPKNISSNTRRIMFNITTSDKASEIGYINHDDRIPKFKRLCRNCDEYGNEKKKFKSLNERQNNITIRATDMFGNIREHNVLLFIDSRPPKISRIIPKKNTSTNGSLFEVKYTEDNLKSLMLFFNPNITLNCTSGRNQFCSTSLNLSSFHNTFIEYFFQLSDGINTENSRSVRVFADTLSPHMIIFMPQNNTITSRRVKFNVTVSESVDLEYLDTLDPKPRWMRLCTNCDEYGNTKMKIKGFNLGNHAVLIRATDDAGNSDTKLVSFTAV